MQYSRTWRGKTFMYPEMPVFTDTIKRTVKGVQEGSHRVEI